MKKITKAEKANRYTAALAENCLAPNCPNCGGLDLESSGFGEAKIKLFDGEWDLSPLKVVCKYCEWETTGEAAYNLLMDC